MTASFNKDVTGTLTDILKRIDNALEFAEKKNGAIVVANMGIIFGLLRLHTGWSYPAGIALTISLSILFVSTYMSLRSFKPILEDKHTEHISSCDNLDIMYFKHAALLTGEEYVSLFKKSTMTPQAADIDLQISRQIVANARIATCKYQCFRKSIALTLAALAFSSIFIFLQLFK